MMRLFFQIVFILILLTSCRDPELCQWECIGQGDHQNGYKSVLVEGTLEVESLNNFRVRNGDKSLDISIDYRFGCPLDWNHNDVVFSALFQNGEPITVITITDVNSGIPCIT